MNSGPGREPLQPLPAMQRPLTPPESQRHVPKYGGMARAESSTSPKRDGKLQVATREEIDLYDSLDSDGEPVQYHDFEDSDEDIVGQSTVKMTDRQRLQETQSNSGWQVSTPSQVRSQSPSKQLAPTRSSQATTPVASRYAKSDGLPVRSSATSSTAMSPTSPSVSQFNSNLPPRQATKSPRKCDALEDILLPALEEVNPANCCQLRMIVLAFSS